MRDSEALSRWEDLHNHVVTQTAQAFVTSFLTRCLRANTEHTAQTDLSMVPVVDMGRLLPRYKHSSKRLLLLDFEGAVWIRDMTRAGLLAPFEPQQEALALLKRFSDDPRNEVWLLSGLPMKGVLDKIAQAVPGIGIVAENGCSIKTMETKKTPAMLVDMVANLNFTWKGPCIEILNHVRLAILRSTGSHTHWADLLLSSQSAHPVHLSRNATPRSSGVSGPGRRTTVPIVNGCVVKQQKRKTTSLTVLASGTVCGSSPVPTRSWSCPTTSRGRQRWARFCTRADRPIRPGVD